MNINQKILFLNGIFAVESWNEKDSDVDSKCHSIVKLKKPYSKVFSVDDSKKDTITLVKLFPANL